ncbi:hypothetical protein TUM3794_20000 [Shewanella colwelliana]|uniref:Uncharacterized protein n=1 Tax=Shewanella colwelliana TaxID=23 RepID=A0ABQ4P0K3_SHECO|nr:hypothetical protein [Shewanella colwelliana]GIU40917.1 hypothetical protein TUM3794_20000 [Shewanella colwelliana]
MTTHEELQQELEYLATTDLTVESPRVHAWMEKAANHLRKDQLLPGQKFVVDKETCLLKKVFIN